MTSPSRVAAPGLFALVAATLTGCLTLPTAPPERALYLDLRSVIETQGRIDWVIDRIEYEKAGPSIMTSACQATPETRLALSGWLGRQIEAEGGSAKAIFERTGDLGDARAALVLERVRGALAYADARQDECPFWLTPDADFTGVQANTRRMVLLAESMGSGQLVLQDGEALIGGAGLGRLLPGVGLSDRVTIAMGLEAGMASTFPRSADGGRTVKPVLTVGVPLLVRILDGTFRYDVDVAAVSRATREEYKDLRYGGRVAVGFGVATLRIAGVMPYAGVWMGYEYLAPGHGEGESHIIRAGSRVGFNWDP